ncbi:LysR family transcriptional regulator [Sphingobium sp. 3R8]|uniref:LysR family transcriptional regulator n=1 Tax=Sphingobium sp. 3R8 TaxID=2874921 RepID=UPI001CCA6908|nr:LysR family transcriptional regulator [Sphingobium sp. 3R8]MBZ9648237.1 LysR family transcriptional regulator [Sphingobium sp. 3R8]
MEQQPLPNPPAGPAPKRRARWTPALQASFLGTLLQTGSVRHAACAVGLSPSSAHRLRRRLAGTEFDRNWDEALMLHDQLMARPLSIDHGAGVARPTIGRDALGARR